MKIFKLIAKFLGTNAGEPSATTSRSQIECITVSPTFSKNALNRIENEWMKSVPHYLRSWNETEIVKFKTFIRASVLAGTRAEALVETIQQNHGIAKEQAEFLARQEVQVFSMKLKQIRYQESGCAHYTWQCVKGSPKYPVRAMHLALNGKTFSWDEPPIVNDKGDRMHPGEDDGCRCNARPIIKF